jgi:hypothetical protein
MRWEATKSIQTQLPLAGKNTIFLLRNDSSPASESGGILKGGITVIWGGEFNACEA